MKPSDLPLAALGPLPRDENGPLFAAPWQAAAFALVLQLHERGLFGWSEWAETFGAELAAHRAGCGPNDPDAYYERWLAALQTLLARKGAVEGGELETMRQAWSDAYARTPHGQPVRLDG